MIYYNKLKRLESELYVAKGALIRENLDNTKLILEMSQLVLVIKLLCGICVSLIVCIIGMLLSQ
jgi:hypothetical protein